MKSSYAPINWRWIGFSEDDAKIPPKAQMPGGEAAVMFPNALR